MIGTLAGMAGGFSRCWRSGSLAVQTDMRRMKQVKLSVAKTAPPCGGYVLVSYNPTSTDGGDTFTNGGAKLPARRFAEALLS